MSTYCGYSESYEKAIRLAATAHRHQDRKGCTIPYITHVASVSVILLRHGFSTDVAIGGLLHDVVEDQGYPLDEIERQFGTTVAEIVAALSEQKMDANGNKRAWELRKQEALQLMCEASLDAVAVKVADTLHNSRCIALDVTEEGSEVWGRFTRGPQPLLGYYIGVLQVARRRMGSHALVEELADSIRDLAKLVKGTGSDSITAHLAVDPTSDALLRHPAEAMYHSE